MIDYSQPKLDLSELGPCPPHCWDISEPEGKVCHAVCLKCGERLYSAATVRRFEQIRAKLERQDVADLKPLGQSFQVA